MKKQNSYRTPDGRAQIDWEITVKENRGRVLSMTGEYDGGSGQCDDSIAEAYPDDAIVQRLVAIWKRWHLNDMRAGTPEQMERAHLPCNVRRRQRSGPRRRLGCLRWHQR